ncbi:MAG: hypothetical protein QM770_23220 [Tepidisphaeraceae bacterium]
MSEQEISSTDAGRVREALHADLRPARTALEANERERLAARAVARATWVALALAVAILVWVALLWLTRLPTSLALWTGGGALIVSLIAIAGSVIAARNRVRIDWRDAAERLDAAVDPHNRVATAVDLGERKSTWTPLETLAIADGLAVLRRSSSTPPVRTPVEWNSRSNWARAVVSVVLIAGAVTVAGWSRDGHFGLGAPSANEIASASRDAEYVRAETTKPPEQPDRTARPENPAQRQSPATSPSTRRPEPNAQQRSSALAASTGAPAPAGSANSSESNAAGSAGGSKGAQSADQRKQDQNHKPTPPPRPNASEPRKPSESSSTIGGGRGSSRSSMDTDNDWNQRDSTSGEPTENADPGDVEPEKNPGNAHRGGLQPMMQDRQQAPLRELGMSGVGTDPGTGRGGPTPPKKSRGTAAMLLAVPIPDFVAAKLLPGLSKTTRVNGEPLPMGRGALDRADVAVRTTDEAPVPRFDPAGREADVLRAYFEQIHSGDERPADPKGP